MVLEKQYPPYLEWLFAIGLSPGAFWIWAITMVLVIVGGLLIAWIFASIRYGPLKAGDLIFRTLVGLMGDLLHTSPRRVLALARLAVQESIRRRVLAGFAVFVVILLFAGWFLNPGKTDPAQLYLSFVLSSTSYLILFMALVLSAFSLPGDIQNKTIFTIVTKPVRPTEVVLGRVLGFTAVGTGLLLLMGVVSYVFVVRTLDHTHVLTAEALSPHAPGPGGRALPGLHGRTDRTRDHQHEIDLDENGHGYTDAAQGHVHEVTAIERDGRTEYRVGPALGQIKARVPLYGKLSFLDRAGRLTDKGVNVGNEWGYRSYIEGGSQAAAIWRFSGLKADEFPNGINFDMTLRVFRTFKGNVEKGISGSITLRNPDNPKASYLLRNFVAKEFVIDRQEIPLSWKDKDKKEIDLFRDVVSADGQLDIVIGCLERAQYFGMALPDMYLSKPEGTPWANFFKGYIAIWLQMVLITTFGVMWSTFLNGPIAMLATIATLVGGYFVSFLESIATGQALGGGMLESGIRIVTQNNLTSELEKNLANLTAIWADRFLQGPLFIMARVLPDLASLNDVRYVADGYNIPLSVLSIHATMSLGFLIPVLILGFLFFKMREVAR